MTDRYLITESEYETLPIETARKYRYCHKCGGYYNSHRVLKCICQIDESEKKQESK